MISILRNDTRRRSFVASRKDRSDLRSVSVPWEKTLAEWDTSGSSCTVGDLVDEAEEGGSLAKSGMVETSFGSRG